MSLSLFEELKRYVGFGVEDEEALRTLLPLLADSFPAIVEEFYSEIMRHPATRRILDDPGRIERLKISLGTWLKEAFLGPHDAEYFEKRTRIGLTHVRVGLPQAFVHAAMANIRRLLIEALIRGRRERLGSLERSVAAVDKVLDLELALIAGSYHQAEKYRDLVELAPDMIHQVDADGRLVSVNRTEQEALGYTEAELQGRKLEELVPPADRPALRRYLAEVFSIGEGRCEVRLLTKSGAELEVEIRGTAERDPLTDRVIRSRGYTRDITHRKRQELELREEKDRAQLFLEVAGVIIIIIHRDTRVALINPKGCEILGRPREEIIGQRWFEVFLPEAARPAARALFNRLISESTETAEYVESPVMAQGGEERTIEWHHKLLRDRAGKVLGTLSSGTDVTDRRRMMRMMMEQQGLARIGEMAAMVAHEVRNPLAGIAGAIQVIGSNLPATDGSQAIIQEILARIDALNGFVSDMLIFARPRPPRLTHVPIVSLLQDTASLLQKERGQERLEIHAEGPDLTVPCDSELLKTVFYNLFLNSAQSLPGKVKIVIRVARARESCIISVTDDGPGIPPGIRDPIFEPFVSTKHQGSGLGLAIARRIVEAHGGAMTFSSPPEGGATFSIELPLELRDPGKI